MPLLSQRYTHGVGNQDFGLTCMIWITVPLPPIQEQGQIILEIERRMSIARTIEEQVDANLSRTGDHRQSILKFAFSGYPIGLESISRKIKAEV